MRRAAGIAAAILVLGPLAGCTDPAEVTQAGVSATPGEDAGAESPSNRPKEPRGGAAAENDGRAKSGDGTKPGKEAAGTGDGDGDETGGDHAALATASSVVEDPAGDAYGEMAPPYAEIVRASITGKGDVAEIVVEVEGDIPERVGERDNLLVGVGIEYGGEVGGIAVSVQGTRDGWIPGIQRDGEQRELEEGWRIEGNRFVWTVPWSDLGGVRRFRWGASLRWFQFNSSDSTEADQAGDRVPDSAPAAYPSKG